VARCLINAKGQGSMAKTTLLYDRHVALGGRLVEFAGWVLPVHYPLGPNAEHLRVRQAAGLFDIDHMGQVVVRGKGAVPFLERVMTAAIADMDPWTARYSLMCYHDGGVVDDTFIYRLGPECFFVAINAANNAKDTRWLNAHRRSFDVTVENVSPSTYMLALQGPRAGDILGPLCETDLSGLLFHQACETRLLTSPPVPVLIGRTGYSGEDGFELFFPSPQAGLVWDALMEAGKAHDLGPVGLAARDSLRFEPCLPLYGQEISANNSPLEAGLGWACALEREGWVGREALLKTSLEGAARVLVGFAMTQGGVPRHGYAVLVDGVVCGQVTSGMYAPTLDKFLGLAYIPSGRAAIGAEVGIQIRDKVRTAVVVERPFYRPKYRRGTTLRAGDRGLSALLAFTGEGGTQ
jgi:aminomethyltransferase